MQTHVLNAFINDLNVAVHTILRTRTLNATERQAFATKLLSKAEALGLATKGPVVLLEELNAYINAKFGTTPSTVYVCGEGFTVKPFTVADLRAEGVAAYIKKIDDQLTEEMRDEPLSMDAFAELLCKLVIRADTSLVPVADHEQLRDELSAYVTAKLNPSNVTTVTIAGQTYAISPVVVDPSLTDPTLNKAVHISDFINKNIELRREAKDIFRPFLIRSIYSHLVGKAFLGHTTTYEAIANEFGLPNKGNQLGSTLSPLLSSIYHFCRNNQQPYLTAIVVRKSGEDKDLPGKGFWDLYNATEDRHERRLMTKDLQAKVFAYWGSLGQ